MPPESDYPGPALMYCKLFETAVSKKTDQREGYFPCPAIVASETSAYVSLPESLFPPEGWKINMSLFDNIRWKKEEKRSAGIDWDGARGDWNKLGGMMDIAAVFLRLTWKWKEIVNAFVKTIKNTSLLHTMRRWFVMTWTKQNSTRLWMNDRFGFPERGWKIACMIDNSVAGIEHCKINGELQITGVLPHYCIRNFN